MLRRLRMIEGKIANDEVLCRQRNKETTTETISPQKRRDANPTRVQKMMRYQHDATTEIYVEEVQKLLEGAEEALTQI